MHLLTPRPPTPTPPSSPTRTPLQTHVAVLYDESQDVAKAYQAACTPEFYVFGKDLELTYHGQYDSSRPSKYGGDTPVTGAPPTPPGPCARAPPMLAWLL